ncbi:MAG: ABC transporter permease [Desulfosudaceae bacterium]
MKKIIYLVQKELRQVRRDPNMLRIIFVVPLVQLLVLGYAITTDIKNLDLIICDQDRSVLSRDLADRFAHNDYFVVQQHSCQFDQAEKYLRQRRAVLVMVIPRDFSRDLELGRSPELQILFDGQNSNTTAVAMGYCNRILLRFMQDSPAGARFGKAGAAPGLRIINPISRAWYNPELKSVYYMIPGIISILLMIITMLLTSMAIVKEREIGTLEQLLVTPLAAWQIIAGKTLPFALLGFIEMVIAMTFGVLWFQVPVVGSLPLLAALSGVFIMTALGMGILISTLVDTQQQALFSAWFCLVSFILLSGFFYPIANMPEWVQLITYLNPLRYFIEILRELLLKGAGLDILWPELLCLAAIGATIFALATFRFSRRASQE